MQGKKGKIQIVPLVVVGIVLIMLIYGSFLPLSEKCKIFPDLPKCGPAGEEEILSESPGLLVPSETAVRYPVPNVQLFRRDSLDIQPIFEETLVSKSWFTSFPAKNSFKVHEGAREVKFFVFLNEGKGSLKIKVNGRTIARLRGVKVHEVLVPLGILKEEQENTIELASSTPLFPFLINRHKIGKVVLREFYTITQNKEERKITIKQNLAEVEKAILRFDTECITDANLTVSLNGDKLIEDKICVGFEKDVKSSLETENTLTFMSDGNYLIRNIRLDLGFKQKNWPTYYFDVSAERLKKPVELKLTFNETGQKKMTIYINGESLSVDTYKLEWRTNVNRFLREGENSIILIPETTLYLSKLELG